MLPGSVEYDAAVQNPHSRFADPELQRCTPERWPMGMIRLRSGAFAYTYRLIPPASSGKLSWAVRCFHQEVPDLRQRYDAISQQLRSAHLSCLIDFHYQDRGIQVSGRWYPIVKMPWISGSTLCYFIAQHLSQPAVLHNLAQRIPLMARELEGVGLAHGDIQDGNIIVQPDGSLKLVDYDSFYVPALRGRPAANRGVADFQHPRRSDRDFGPTMDRFSFLVLYLGIAGTAARPELWPRYCPGDANILLKQQDFLDPTSSPVLRELERISSLAALVRSFRSICLAPFDQVPALDDVLTRQPVLAMPSRPLTSATPWSSPYPVIAATDRERLLAHEGQIVEVVGRVQYVFYDPTRATTQGTPYAHINFGNRGEGMFDIPLWWEALEPLLRAGRDPQVYSHQWVSITGLVSVYRRTGELPQPEIVPDWYGTIVMLPDEAAARARLGSSRTPLHPRPAMPPARPSTIHNAGRGNRSAARPTEQEILTSLYSGRKAPSTPQPAAPARRPPRPAYRVPSPPASPPRYSPASPGSWLAAIIQRLSDIVRRW